MAITQKNILGVLGGMGPVASAEFLRTIYDYDMGEREQLAPIVFLYSDPSFPDRTDAFIAGDDDVILKMLVDALGRLRKLGASRIVICCMTIHYLLPKLRPALRGRIVSMLDVIFANIPQSEQKHLLICSSGSRRLKLFENHEKWEASSRSFLLPEDADQDRIHRSLIYPIKRSPDIGGLFPFLVAMLEKYEVDSFIVGCSEVHLLAKRFLSDQRYKDRYGCIDPFAIIANQIRQDRR